VQEIESDATSLLLSHDEVCLFFSLNVVIVYIVVIYLEMCELIAIMFFFIFFMVFAG
jgi:hypothetical protein